jgi:hypothetical protein
MTDIERHPRPWGGLAAAGIVAAIGIGVLWTFRATGGICVDGPDPATSGCDSYSSQVGAAPASIAILVLYVGLIVAVLLLERRPLRIRRIAYAVFVALVVLAVVIGSITSLTIIDYPEGYPR